MYNEDFHSERLLNVRKEAIHISYISKPRGSDAQMCATAEYQLIGTDTTWLVFVRLQLQFTAS